LFKTYLLKKDFGFKQILNRILNNCLKCSIVQLPILVSAVSAFWHFGILILCMSFGISHLAKWVSTSNLICNITVYFENFSLKIEKFCYLLRKIHYKKICYIKSHLNICSFSRAGFLIYHILQITYITFLRTQFFLKKWHNNY
jgi:hypothetical protein